MNKSTEVEGLRTDKLRRSLRLILAVAAIAGAAGCLSAEEAEGAGGAEDEVQGQEQALTYDVSNSWSQGGAPKVLASASDHFCYLTGVRGKFEGAGERVKVEISNGYWVLGGASGTRDVRAFATCVPLTQGTRRFSYTSESYVKQGMGTVNLGPTSDKRICFLTGVTGQFHGAGEEVKVGMVGDGTWGLSAKSGTRDVAAWARCLVGPFTVVPTSSQWYQAYPTGETQSNLSTVDWFCGLTMMTGLFAGAGESLTVIPRSYGWVIAGTSGTRDVGGRMECSN